MLYLLVLLTALGLMVYCSLDVLKTPADQVRLLPKPLWLALLVAFPLLAALPWLLVGRAPAGTAAGGSRTVAPRPPVRPVHPDDDEDFLRGLRERAEEQRRRAREQEPPPAA